MNDNLLPKMDYEYKITFVLPCLNEEKSLAKCLNEIRKCINDKMLDAEILVSDNGSTDNSIKIAKENGARVVISEEKGYGNALINGTKHALGEYCIMGDSDGTYDFYNIDDFLKKLDEGYELVVGNRYKGGIEKGAMPLLHYFGVFFLTFFANIFFKTPIKDFHCGLRAYKTEVIKKLDLHCGGMEYASEMIIAAKINNLKIIELPTILREDEKDRKPHLRTFRDGFRHLFLIINMWIRRKSYIRKIY